MVSTLAVAIVGENIPDVITAAAGAAATRSERRKLPFSADNVNQDPFAPGLSYWGVRHYNREPAAVAT